MVPTLRYILLIARRDRLFAALALLVALACALSAALGSAAIVEREAMALAFAGASVRLVFAVGLAAFVLFSLRRLFDSGEIPLLLSRPLARTRFVLAAWAGYALVAALLALPAWAAVWLVGPPPGSGFAAWGASLLLEATLVVALALFFGLVLTSPVAALAAVLGFYVLARMMRFFVAILDAGWADHAGAYGRFVEMATTALAAVMPRLDLFARTDWLVAGAPPPATLALIAGQWLIYLPLLLAATAFDLGRRRF